jgi:hypothetical protein
MRRLRLFVVLALVLSGVSATTAQADHTASPIGIFIGVNTVTLECELIVLVDGASYHTASVPMKFTKSADGGSVFQCAADLVTPAPKQALAITDAPFALSCWDGVTFAIPTSWTLVITPAGRLFYTCRAPAG